MFYEARALFDYQPVASDELYLRAGDSIEVRIGGGDREEEGWLYGTDKRGCHGLLPANYVAEVRTPAAADNAGSPDAAHVYGSEGVVSALPYERRDGAASTGAGTLTALLEEKENMDARSSHDPQNDFAGAASDPAQQSTSASADDDGGYGGTTTNATSQPSQVAATAVAVQQKSTQPPNSIEEDRAVPDADGLPDGWLRAVDEGSGITYYYTADGRSSWTRPLATDAEPPQGVAGRNVPAAAGVDPASGPLSSTEVSSSRFAMSPVGLPPSP